MPKSVSHIVRFGSLLLAMLLLFVSVWSKSMASSGVLEKQEKHKTEHKDREKTAYISELSPMTVTVPTVIDFQQIFYLLPQPIFIDYLATVATRAIPKPLFIISFLDNIFEHYIAINAP